MHGGKHPLLDDSYVEDIPQKFEDVVVLDDFEYDSDGVRVVYTADYLDEEI